MTSDITAKGGCLCKAVTYELSGQPNACGVCYCINCQKTSGSALVANLIFTIPNVIISDPNNALKWYEDKGDSGAPFRRAFCSTCGSSLFNRPTPKEGAPVILAVCSGTIDGISQIEQWKPMFEIYCDRKRKWLPEIGGVKSFSRSIAGLGKSLVGDSDGKV